MNDQAPTTGGNELLAPVRQHPNRSAIVCDIDGTLAPIVLEPENASVPHQTRDLLIKLNRRYALVACLSGRRAADARRVVGVRELTYLGNHGLEVLEAGSQRTETLPGVSSHAPAVRAFAAEAYTPELRNIGIRLEDKDAIWSFHWRGAPGEAAAHAALEPVAKRASQHGLIPHWGRKVLEIRPPLPVDKGTAIARVLRDSDVEAALYAGDDATDLDAFRALRQMRSNGELQHVVCVGVRSEDGPPQITTEADLVVDGPEGVRGMLATLAT